MSEVQKVEHRNLGYFWNYTLEIESVVPVEGTRASAKTTEKYNLGGNTESYLLAKQQLDKAKAELKERDQGRAE